MAKLIVDGKEIEVPDNYTLLQACEAAGAEIPRFCYHERLSIAGNCRMCLVAVEGMPKPAASCAIGARDLRPPKDGDLPIVHTNTPDVRKMREGVMEFLLINHPLDCPICDQGGECDLQDQSMIYGTDHTRFSLNKRAVEDKYMGPLIKTIMTRCIHCTRCIRFATEIAGVSELGAIGRGEDMEIVTYLEHSMTSELSGNVIDLCPVGALTSRPYAFTARPWELKKTESVDVMDAVGSNIRVDSRGREVMRILPRNNDVINEEWISDKTRFIWDGLRRQRLDRPYVRRGGRLYQASWEEAFGVIAAKAKEAGPGAMAAIAGDLVCAESMFALKQLMQSLGVRNLECRQDGSALGGAPRQGYLFNTSIQGIERADALLLIGTDPRREAPLVNTRIRKRYLKRGFKGIGLIGPGNDLTYDHEHLGAGPKTLQEIAEGRHPFADVLKKAERPMLILGQGALSRDDGAAILAAAAKIAEDTGMLIAPDADGAGGWNGFNVLHTAASRVAGLDLGFLPQEGGRDLRGILQGCRKGDISFVYLLGADEIDMAALGKAFVVYQGSHGDAGASRADVVLPGAAYTEKNAFWVNTEGRLQLGKRAVFPPGDAREDWAILRALSAVLGKQLPYDSLTELRGELSAASPVFTTINYAPGADGARPGLLEDVGRAGKMSDTPFVYPVTDFYLTNAIARASETMAECSKIILGGVQAVQAAE